MIIKFANQQLKTCIADIVPILKNADKTMANLRRAQIMEHNGALWLVGTDRYIAVRSRIAWMEHIEDAPDVVEPFELSIESLELLSKLNPSVIEVTPKGVSALASTGTVTVGKLDDGADFPNIHKMINDSWGLPNDDWARNDGETLDSIPGFKPGLVKHIKDVVIIPRPGKENPARLSTDGREGSRIEGIMMPIKFGLHTFEAVRG